MLEILKKLFGAISGGKGATPENFSSSNSSASTSSSARRRELASLKLHDAKSLPLVDGAFTLVWSIQHDREFEDILLYEFTTHGGILIARELATFADFERAMQLVSMLHEKYGKQWTEFCLAPGVAVYIGGNDNAGWSHFMKHVSELGFDLIKQENDTKRDVASRELLMPETTFRLRQ
ncbi:MAG: hypothetical protein JST89_21845 [Cyanobacteria bacterium SZAS-4]|nr:hypothetical protein [Cyanobacteria bacterium SZAS-4]